MRNAGRPVPFGERGNSLALSHTADARSRFERNRARTFRPWRAPFAFMARTILTVSLLAAAAAQITMPAPFSAGTLSVLRVGSGTAPIAPLQHQQVDMAASLVRWHQLQWL